MSNPLRRKIELECGYILTLRPASSQFKHDIIDEAAGKSMTQDVWIGNDCSRLEIPCQDVNFYKSLDMRRICETELFSMNTTMHFVKVFT